MIRAFLVSFQLILVSNLLVGTAAMGAVDADSEVYRLLSLRADDVEAALEDKPWSEVKPYLFSSAFLERYHWDAEMREVVLRLVNTDRQRYLSVVVQLLVSPTHYFLLDTLFTVGPQRLSIQDLYRILLPHAKTHGTAQAYQFLFHQLADNILAEQPKDLRLGLSYALQDNDSALINKICSSKERRYCYDDWEFVINEATARGLWDVLMHRTVRGYDYSTWSILSPEARHAILAIHDAEPIVEYILDAFVPLEDEAFARESLSQELTAKMVEFLRSNDFPALSKQDAEVMRDYVADQLQEPEFHPLKADQVLLACRIWAKKFRERGVPSALNSGFVRLRTKR